MSRSIRVLILALVLSVLSIPAYASWYPERRKNQFDTFFAYAVFPYPYSLPGIGSGLGIVGGAMNIGGTNTDAYGMAFGGDVNGIAGGVGDIHIIPRTLIADIGISDLSKATIQSYSQRGMNTGKHDFTNVELGNMVYYGSRLTATFADRRFEIYGAFWQGSSELKSIRDQEGTVQVTAEGVRHRGHVSMIGTRLDLTDDYYDPRRGFRLDVTRSFSPPSDNGPDFYTQDYSATGFIPIGRRSTWAFNYLRSDAHVDREGETDGATIQKILGLNCNDPALKPEQRQSCNDYVANTIANNKYGTASSLGGFSRLRSYSSMRYKGAHTEFYGTELRWNLTDESTPYDIFLMKDIRTAWQVAAFYEIGSTADVRNEVGDIWRSSTGIGLRMVGASGVVFRADVAWGKEGISPSIFIGYPWEL